MEKFRNLGINEPILKSIRETNFTEPSEIQEKAIPLVLAGKDLIAESATGSGKTFVFGAGILQKIEKNKGVQTLILTPTRELAEQVCRALKTFAKYSPFNVIAVYGGVSISPQIHELESAEIVVGTPGRVLDHINRESIDLRRLKILVLDEADRMLDMGFIRDVEKIIDECPEKRQTLMFSATIYQEIMHLSKKYMKNPIEISAENYVDPAKLRQSFYDIPQNLKFSLLVHLLKNEKSELVMIFCNTRISANFVARNLNSVKINTRVIHGGLTQNRRTNVMEDFHKSRVSVLVCTDIAARGIDIKNISHVYNYDIPKNSKDYIHRIGRTARAGEEGIAINLVSQRDYENFSEVISDSSLTINKENLPEDLPFIKLAYFKDNRQERSRFHNSRNYRNYRHERGDRSYDRREDYRERRFRNRTTRNFRSSGRSRFQENRNRKR